MKNEKRENQKQQEQPEQQTKPKGLLDLSDDILMMIAALSETSDLTRIGGTNRRLHHLFHHELDLRRNAKAAQLMGYFLDPTPENLANAKLIYDADPLILFIKTEGYEKASGIEEYVDEETGETCVRAVHRKVVNCSPFQALLGMGDRLTYADTIKYFIDSKDRARLVQEQIQEKFPDGLDYPPSEYDFLAIIHAIGQDKNLIETGEAGEADEPSEPSEETQKMLAKFRKDFLPKDVTQGHHFNLNHLSKALELYGQLHDGKYGQWTHKQLSLFWCQVIGYLELLVPVNVAFELCQGLDPIFVEKKTPVRSLTLFNYQSFNHVTYYPEKASASGLGFDYGIDIGPKGVGVSLARGGSKRPGPVEMMKMYVELHQHNLTSISNLVNEILTEKLEDNPPELEDSSVQSENSSAQSESNSTQSDSSATETTTTRKKPRDKGKCTIS